MKKSIMRIPGPLLLMLLAIFSVSAQAQTVVITSNAAKANQCKLVSWVIALRQAAQARSS
ncbi:MAG: hypothetical protein ACLQAH_16750 [Limisphaerales bacterium]